MTDVFQFPARTVPQSRLAEVDFDDLAFGKVFSDHMFTAEYADSQWQRARIEPYAPITITPANAALHYGQSIFEGMKAYKNDAGEVLTFRPLANLDRFNRSAERMCMPRVPEEVFMGGLHQLLKLDQAWVPDHRPGASLYIRPFMYAADEYIGVRPSLTYRFVIFTCPVGVYYSAPVKVKVESRFVRAVEGGVGYAKTAGNYAAAMYPTMLAQREGYDQLIWTDGSTHQYIEESGTMNVLFVIDNVLITAPTTDSILKGVTRDSVLALARQWGMRVEERKITVSEVVEAIQQGRLQEAFGAGTAATIAHIAVLHHQGTDYQLPDVASRQFSHRAFRALDDIKHGRAEAPEGWVYKID